MLDDLSIVYLADHLDTIPSLVAWFRSQWPDYYSRQTQVEIEKGFEVEAVKEGLPLRLIALKSSDLVGTVCLREIANDSLPEFRPGLGGLFVKESERGQGIATALIRAGMNEAIRQGYQTIYASTAVAGGVLNNLGWAQIKSFIRQGETQIMYQVKLI